MRNAMKMKSRIFVNRRRLLMDDCSSMTSLLAALSCIEPILVASLNVHFNYSILTSSGYSTTSLTSSGYIVDMGDAR
jgi:hypothetical protein